MALRMRRAVAAAVLGVAAAGSLAGDCQAGLELLQGRSDAELAARCRASFAPEVCREVGLALGEQPWSSDHVARGCARFADALPATGERGLEARFADAFSETGERGLEQLEAALAAEAQASVSAPASVEEAVLKKAPVGLEARSEVAPTASMGPVSEEELPGGEAKEARANAQQAMGGPLRTLMKPSKGAGMAKPAPQKAVDAPLRTLTNFSEEEGMAEPAPEKARKGLKERQMTPLHEGAAAESEPEGIHTARMALRRAVERAKLRLGKTGSTVRRSGGLGSLREHAPEQLGDDLKLFEDIGSLKEHAPDESGLQLALLLGIASFAAMGTFVRLSTLRTRRPERSVAASLLDAEQDVEQDSPASSAHTVVE